MCVKEIKAADTDCEISIDREREKEDRLLYMRVISLMKHGFRLRDRSALHASSQKPSLLLLCLC